MAEIDKSLPNIDPNAIPDEAIIETEKKAEVVDTPTGPVEIAMDETGGAEVSFDPSAPEIDPAQDHFANLAETMPDNVLEPLLKKLGRIDIFFHDSLHTYKHMLFEYNTCWDYLKDNGILISDDIIVMNGKGHSPFVDFAHFKHRNIIVNNVIGGIRK